MEKEQRKILVVGCHPDDVELGCGGTIAKHLEMGHKVYALILTRGQQGKHTVLSQEECRNSMKILGIDDVFFGELVDGYVEDNHKVVSMIEQYIVKLGIDRVYTHYYNDRHQDHRNCSRAVSAAARKVPEIFLYEGPSTLTGFEAHYYIGLTDEQLQKKLDALSCYKSQIEKGIVNLHWIRSLAGVHGSVCNTKYAEAFALNHVFRGEDNV